MTCDAHLRTMCAQWVEMLPAFQSPAELSSTHINTLWAGATFIMTIRASRAASWGVPEVEQSCRAQLEAHVPRCLSLRPRPRGVCSPTR